MVFKKGLLAGLIFSLVFIAANNCFSAAQKIGVMDTKAIILSSDSGKAASERMLKKKAELEAAVLAEEEALKKLSDEMQIKQSAWNDETKAKKMAEYQEKGRAYQAKVKGAQKELQELEQAEFQPIYAVFEDMVDKYGKDNGYSVILVTSRQNPTVFYSDQSVVLTDIFVKKLNEAMARK